ncbi:hypothetical protein OG883_01700 [Streptomyces sp. NBC_01142]|uniref:hypothetical protein n=1 Tax=Streptomyces sp. NBC_01142 TaxID=2975865 RepID=UPI00225A7944|nr:hypothetical protein [Streptomyces sp. NBC_01142]MCX4818638.1 hypothetical protein [Streptomyces sp. NBC_01142]
MRTSARYASWTTAALAAVLLASGCSSDGDGKAGDSSTPAPSTSAPADTTPPPSGGGKTKPGSLDGGWTTDALHADQGLLILTVVKQDVVLVGKTSCTGRAATDAEPVTFSLKCKDGSKDFATGTVDSLEGSTLKVTWASGKTDTFTKGPDVGKLPIG